MRDNIASETASTWKHEQYDSSIILLWRLATSVIGV